MSLANRLGCEEKIIVLCIYSVHFESFRWRSSLVFLNVTVAATSVTHATFAPSLGYVLSSHISSDNPEASCLIGSIHVKETLDNQHVSYEWQ